MLFTNGWHLKAAAALLFCAGAANAEIFSFTCVTGNNAANCATGTQYTVDVANAGNSLVSFKFKNTAAVASSIFGLYFDQTAKIFDSVALPTYSSGVRYFPNILNPKNFPGPVKFDTDLSFDRLGSASNGIDKSSEYATVRLGISNNQTYSDVLNAMKTGSLRIGLHVGAFAGGGSEAFLSQVPEPATYGFVLTLGVGTLLFLARRRNPVSKV